MVALERKREDGERGKITASLGVILIAESRRNVTSAHKAVKKRDVMEGGVLDLHTRDRREGGKEVGGGDFGVKNREQGNDLLDDKEGEKYVVLQCTRCQWRVLGILKKKKTWMKKRKERGCGRRR